MKARRIKPAPAPAFWDTSALLLLICQHPLRAADSLQLSAALIWCNHNPSGKTYICDDTKLIEVAEKEGFNVVRM
jgi:hypothetical protein